MRGDTANADAIRDARHHRAGAVRSQKVMRVCAVGSAALVSVSTAYNLRYADPTVFGWLTFLLPPLSLAMAAWLAHSVDHRGLAGGAAAIAATCFAISASHIYDGAVADKANSLHAVALPVVIDGLAIMLTYGYLTTAKRERLALAAAEDLEVAPGPTKKKPKAKPKLPAATASAGGATPLPSAVNTVAEASRLHVAGSADERPVPPGFVWAAADRSTKFAVVAACRAARMTQDQTARAVGAGKRTVGRFWEPETAAAEPAA